MGRGDFSKIPNGGHDVENRMGLIYHHGVTQGRISLNRLINALVSSYIIFARDMTIFLHVEPSYALRTNRNRITKENKGATFIEAGMRKSVDGFRFKLDPETYGSWRPADLWKAVEEIPCPMLILRAEHSIVMSRSAAESMARKAPNARLKEIGGAGHFLMLGKPAEVANEIRGFLEEAPP